MTKCTFKWRCVFCEGFFFVYFLYRWLKMASPFSKPFGGDGWCDTINNRAYCQYDGGDCCPSTLSTKKVHKHIYTGKKRGILALRTVWVKLFSYIYEHSMRPCWFECDCGKVFGPHLVKNRDAEAAFKARFPHLTVVKFHFLLAQEQHRAIRQISPSKQTGIAATFLPPTSQSARTVPSVLSSQVRTETAFNRLPCTLSHCQSLSLAVGKLNALMVWNIFTSEN